MSRYDSDPITPRNLGDLSAPHATPVTAAEDIRSIMLNRISMGAVFSGVAVALVTQLVLNLFGLGFGIVSLSNGTVTTPTFSWGAAVFLAISGVIAAFAGGLAAGRLSGEPREGSATWHGIVSWAASVLIVASLAVAGGGAVLSGSLSTVGGISINRGSELNLYVPEGRNIIPPQTAEAEPVNAAVAPGAAALASAIGLLLGGIAAGMGGCFGTVKPTITRTDLRRQLH